LDSSGRQKFLAGSCKHGNEHFGSIEGRELD
jgi:hypothetical protein